MNRYIILVTIIGILIASGYAIAKDSERKFQFEHDDEESVKAVINNPPTIIPGDIFSGDYIRIGVNNGGALGITGNTILDFGVGLQSIYDIPFRTPSTESIALGYWTEGYHISYRTPTSNKAAYWYTSLGYPPPTRSNIKIISSTVLANDNDRAIKKIFAKTTDGTIGINFTWKFLKRYPNVNLETTISNIGTSKLRNVVYKRTVDLDVCATWTNNWHSSADSAQAVEGCVIDNLAKVIIITFAGRDGVDAPVAFVDLDGYYDRFNVGPGTVVQDFYDDISLDGSPTIYYNIGDLDPKKSKKVYTIYQTNFPIRSNILNDDIKK